MGDRTVLIVDDDRLLRWGLGKELLTRRLPVRLAGSATEALESCRRTACRLAFVDARLPDANGLELLRSIRETSPETEVVVLCSDGSEPMRRRAFDEGASQFIEKPFELSDIIRVVTSAFGRYPRKRAHKRYLCRLALRLALADFAAEDAGLDLRHLRGTSIEVSKAGLRARTDYALQPGQRLRCSVMGAKTPCSKLVPPDATGRVIWVAREEGGIVAGVSIPRAVNPDRTS